MSTLNPKFAPGQTVWYFDAVRKRFGCDTVASADLRMAGGLRYTYLLSECHRRKEEDELIATLDALRQSFIDEQTALANAMYDAANQPGTGETDEVVSRVPIGGFSVIVYKQ